MTATDVSAVAVKTPTLKRAIRYLAFVVGAVVYSVLYHYFPTIVEPLVIPVCSTAMIITLLHCFRQLTDALRQIRGLYGSIADRAGDELEDDNALLN